MQRKRRQFLRSLARSAAFATAGSLALNWTEVRAALKPLGAPSPFDYAGLKGQARALAAGPYVSHTGKLPTSLDGLDWDQYQSIQFRPDHALWGDQKLRFQAKFFHLGLFFKRPVRMYELADGQAQELAYDPEMFDYGKSGLKAASLPADLGFAGFRLNFHTDPKRDVAAFLGASYFRAVGGEWQYGQSARGLAINTGGIGPRSSRTSWRTSWSGRRRDRTPWWCSGCSTRPASRAPIASRSRPATAR